MILLLFQEQEVNGRCLCCVVDDFLSNSTVSLDDDLVDLLRSLDRVGLVIDPCKLLKRTALSFDTVGKMKVSKFVFWSFIDGESDGEYRTSGQKRQSRAEENKR